MLKLGVLFIPVGLLFAASAGVAQGAAGNSAFKTPPETYDWVPAMKAVAKKFTGTQGVFVHIGDSITYANQNTRWAKYGKGHTPETKAFLKWTHNGKKDKTDGWWLAYVDVPHGRSHTAASGVRADEYLKGGKHGLPSLARIIKTYNPQLALYMLGTNDLHAGRPVGKYIVNVEKALDMLLANGTVVMLSTLPPFRGKTAQVAAYNKALRALAAKKKIPLIDLHAEMKARAGAEMGKLYLGPDGIHLSHKLSAGPPTEENLKRCGYLLRCYLAVHKGMEVKKKVFDAQ